MNRRRMSLVLALASVLVLAAFGWLVPLSRNSQAAPAPSSDAAFKGKVLMVVTNNITLMGTYVMEKAQVQKIGDHSFLVGKGTAPGEGGNVGWHKGQTVRVQMQHIVSITEFDNLKDLEKASTTIIGGGPAALTPVWVAPAGSIPVPPAPPAVPAPPREE